MDDAERLDLARIHLEAIEAELADYMEELRRNCLHYAPLEKKWDAGRCPVFCSACGLTVFRWDETGMHNVDA